MPELPEVETVKRGLEPVLAGRRLVRVEQRRPDLRFPLPERFGERIACRVVTAIDRRAKYMLWHLDSGETLIVHLGMSGRFTITPTSAPLPSTGRGRGWGEGRVGAYVYATGTAAAHDHVVFHTEDGATVTYNDPRRFGFMLLVPGTELETHPLMRGLGIEPLGNGLNAAYLAMRARGRKADLKAFLLDQRIVAGLGNIYVSEALHRAGISPHRAAGCLAKTSGSPTDRCERLIPAIRDVLTAAIEAGGSTLRDYRHADGALGGFQHQFLVYDRDGEPCQRAGCGGMVRRTIQAGRSTFHCASCQR
ncbi:MAG: bifunctional DNA-formamidopyrimidine glycosylase/DNA-(apurinic or apyrimidinic site) lyase [Hyphomicrobium sp.]|nr:bifunctional DNA-formamidopyrimidine glycosylase/DNA-(apurinic or apyrimidinic site) lyase [Hyphomicrobium sp.]PPC82895.1 MAG: bifunctional DNA-formamidopyrimidine glycosylase/DNA-(apurinic or apyrimidinic site) lyase [Hyphomicrobium sp.]